MWVGITELTFRIDGCRSLKDKRRVIRSLVDRLRHHFNLSVAEVGLQDVWDQARIGVAAVSGERAVVERLLEEVLAYAEANCEAELTGVETEIL